MRLKITASLVLLAMIGCIFSACEKRKGPPGTQTNPVNFYFMPLKGEDVFEKNAPVLKKHIESKTGIVIKPIASPDFISIIKAFSNKKADVAFINTLGYLMARDWSKAEARLMSIYGDIYKDYQGEILVQVKSGINSLADLNGKKIAFADPFSASGYLYAMKLLEEKNVKPGKIIYAGGHKKAVEMVYNGEVDAAATYHSRPSVEGVDMDARSELIKNYPDIFLKLKILALTDKIPNGPVAFRADLPEDIKVKLTNELLNFSQTVEGRQILFNLYNMTGLAPASDKDYDPVGQTIKSVGKSIEEMVPGGVTFYNMKIGPLLHD
jgi:phosphonate transport system substrate-binding protein